SARRLLRQALRQGNLRPRKTSLLRHHGRLHHPVLYRNRLGLFAQGPHRRRV
ncbi:hypothetical protein D7B24_007629, partial [Verticillium nonalfalfae]